SKIPHINYCITTAEVLTTEFTEITECPHRDLGVLCSYEIVIYLPNFKSNSGEAIMSDLRDLNEAGQKVSGRAPYQVSQGYMLAEHMVTTAFAIDGYRVVRNLGVVRGITVRSRSILGNIAAGLQTIVGGNITMLTKLCETARSEAFKILVQHASEI